MRPVNENINIKRRNENVNVDVNDNNYIYKSHLMGLGIYQVIKSFSCSI